MGSPGVRAQRTLATRRRMVKAAYDLFCTQGYLGTTMAAVASRAGVAGPTVYYTFTTKAALLGEALGAAIVGFDRWHEPPAEIKGMAEILPWHHWWDTLLAAPTSSAALAVFITNGCEVLDRVAPLMPAMHGSAGDPEAAGFVRRNDENRTDAYREVLRVVAAKPSGLRAEVSLNEATDVVSVLFSPEVYQAFSARGWTRLQSTHFYVSALTAQLLVEEPRRTPSSNPAAGIGWSD